MQTRKITVEDYKKLPEGAPYELIDGILLHEPSPGYGHQRLLMSLSSDIYQYVKEKNLGEVLIAPMDVFLDEENVFQPDILFVSKENRFLIRNDGIHGAPDLVIEILSLSNAYRDNTTKLRFYERYGVKEYFIIDPEPKEVTAYFNMNGKFKEIYLEGGVVRSAILQKEFSL